MAIIKTPTPSKPQARTSFDDVEQYLDRHGRTKAPLIWSEDTDPEKVQAWRDSGRKSHKKPKTGEYYKRTTTYIDVLGDKSNLEKWKIRKALDGALAAPGLMDQFAALEDPFGSKDDKSAADRIIEEMLDVAGQHLRADAGTAVHEMLEQYDGGGELQFIPPDVEADVEAYISKTQDLEMLGIELFCVQDTYKVAGTFDRLVRVHGETAEKMGVDDGTVVIADLKTGSSISYDFGKICMQLAGYANMKVYDIKTFKRSDVHPDLNREVGIVIHLPLGEGECNLYKADLLMGWHGFQFCDEVHRWRSHWGAKANAPVPLI